ncbi:hypothetical protein MJH12_14690, partial [bacterium]|nr:hypothetical protein [bacterium]
NSILVKGSFDQLLGIAKYLDTIVYNQSKQVRLNVKVLEVSLNDSTETGIDWTTIGKKINQIGTSYVHSPYNIADNFFTITSNDPTKNYNIVFKALQNHGRVKLIQEPYQVTMNNQPAYFRVGDTRDYVKSSTTTISDNGLATATFETATLNEGLTMQILPSIAERDEITLNISTKIVTLNELRTISQGNGGQQLEAVNTSESMSTQTVRMHNGATLILGGMTSSTYRRENGGVPRLSRIPILNWFTGKKRRKSTKKEVVFLIQATVLYPDLKSRDL